MAEETGSSETLIGWKSGKTTYACSSMGPNGGSMVIGYGPCMGHGERSLLDQTGLLIKPNHLHKSLTRCQYASRTGRQF